jgi:hypothetical protein
MNNINQLLNNLTLGTKQEVGMMSVIPLIGKDIEDKIADIEDISFEGTYTYGTMTFKNSSNKPAIIPNGYSVLTPQKAQDHGIPFACLVKPNVTEHINVACCIEQTQPGMIDGSLIKDFSLLPLYVKQGHFKKYINVSKSQQLDFSRLWSIISEFQKNLVEESSAHLIYFFNKFVDKLNQFNAEFEAVPNQRGAIIMINNKIVGIEIVPTQKYWKSVWQKLIRDCYGSEVIRLTVGNLVKEFKSSQSLEVDLTSCKTIDEIEEVIQSHQLNQKNNTQELLDSILSKKFHPINIYQEIVNKNTFEDIKYSLLSSDDKSVYGELYSSNEGILYCSILLT